MKFVRELKKRNYLSSSCKETISIDKYSDSRGIEIYAKDYAVNLAQTTPNINTLTCDFWKVLRLRAFDAFIKACDGQATKVLIPTDFKDMTRLLTTVESVKATVEDKKTNRPWDKTIDKTDEKKSDKAEKPKTSTGDKR